MPPEEYMIESSRVMPRTRDVFVVFLLAAACSGRAEWQLPVGLGDSRDTARRVLGDREACVQGAPSTSCDSFPNSGISVEYDGERVHAVTVAGGSPAQGVIPYQSAIVYGITIHDRLKDLKGKLGEPTAVDVGPPTRYKWRRPPLLVEVVLGSKADGDQQGKILWVSLSSAAG